MPETVSLANTAIKALAVNVVMNALASDEGIRHIKIF